MPGRRNIPKVAKASQRNRSAEHQEAIVVVRLKALGFFGGVSIRRRAALAQVERELAVSIVEAAQ